MTNATFRVFAVDNSYHWWEPRIAIEVSGYKAHFIKLSEEYTFAEAEDALRQGRAFALKVATLHNAGIRLLPDLGVIDVAPLQDISA